MSVKESVPITSSTISKLEHKEPNKDEIKKKIKEIILNIFTQIKTGCKKKICYNIYCKNNLYCKESKKKKYILILYFNYFLYRV